MTDFFFQIGLSNACLALALGIVAMVVGATTKRSHLAHLLWLLVFVKLVTPPIVTIPLIAIPEQSETAVAMNGYSPSGPPLANSREFDVDAQSTASLWSRIESVGLNHGKEWLAAIWLLGSVVVFAWSMVRVCRFSRLLTAESEVAPPELQTAAVKIGRRLELNTIPTICTTSARISPMVWWTGGKVRIVIPTTLLDQMAAQQWQWILAHELAHVRRRDYMVRWLEWLACVCFWWNPVVWWAQRNLRATEEICCDALVVSGLNPKSGTYAESLLTAIECLARPLLPPPAMASEINSGGYLERRFKRIVSGTPIRKTSTWLTACVLLCAIVVLPLGLVYARNDDAGIEEHLNRLGVTDQHVARTRKVFRDNGLTDEQIEQTLGGMVRVVYEVQSEGEDFELAPGLRNYFENEVNLTDEQIELVRRHAQRLVHGRRASERERGEGDRDVGIEEHFNKLGITDLARLRKALQDSWLTDKQIGQTLRVMIKIIYEVQSEGKDFELDPGLRNYFENEVGLTDEQIELVQGLAIRLAQWNSNQRRDEGDRGSKRITKEDYARAEADLKKAIAEGRISGEDARARLEGMRKAMAEQGERGSKRITKEDYARAEADLKKAVAEGKISGEDVRVRLEGMRKMMAEQGDIDVVALRKRLGAASDAGRMTKEEARAKFAEMVKQADAEDKNDAVGNKGETDD